MEKLKELLKDRYKDLDPDSKKMHEDLIDDIITYLHQVDPEMKKDDCILLTTGIESFCTGKESKKYWVSRMKMTLNTIYNIGVNVGLTNALNIIKSPEEVTFPEQLIDINQKDEDKFNEWFNNLIK